MTDAEIKTLVLNTLLSCMGEDMALRVYVKMIEAGIRFRLDGVR